MIRTGSRSRGYLPFVTEKVDRLADVLRRPTSYCISSFEEAAAFLDGFDAAREFEPLMGLREWLAAELGENDSLVWPVLARRLLSRRDIGFDELTPAAQVEALFSLVRMFLSRDDTEAFSWDGDAVGRLRGGVDSEDPSALAVLEGRPLQPVLQYAGDLLLIALAAQVNAAPALAEECVRALDERLAEGDHALAEQLRAVVNSPPTTLDPVPVDLDDLAETLTGDPEFALGVLDIQTGQLWPSDDWGDDERPDPDDEDRWRSISNYGDYPAYEEMLDFTSSLMSTRLRTRLLSALEGKGAFRRFRDVLEEHPHERDSWLLFKDERRRGVARAWLADRGFRPWGRPKLG